VSLEKWAAIAARRRLGAGSGAGQVQKPGLPVAN